MPSSIVDALASFTVPARPDQIGMVRRCLREFTSWLTLAPDLLADLLLMTCEVLTNAVQHGCSPDRDDDRVRIDVQLIRASAVRVSVTDPGHGYGRLPWPGEEEEHGRGLLIVAALATDLGEYTAADGAHTVWFTLGDCSALPSPR
ncbi:ATP-binding protein [Kitasatospora viridis]|uniref:ATP-binding protein n=1 Tax=Kitasatospora viridis TaxID=281105 RepID=UPI0014790332|nr:ATP-binding protein [Kitasatospora viridis]